MLKKGIICPVTNDSNVYVSNIFTREKPDGSLRIILDLTELNKSVVYRHFKMDNLQMAINLMSRDCLMASIDWKDAYYSVPVAKEFRKYLCFQWNGMLFQYTCLPNGLASAPRNFTKLTKVLFSELRKAGYQNTSYIDDSFLAERSVETCKESIERTVQMSLAAGFVVHPEKSVLVPTQRITYLGFWLDSKAMTVQLTAKKAEKLKNACNKLLHKTTCTILELAQAIGLMVASLPGVQYGKMYYRTCDNYKSLCLKENRGNFAATIPLTEECRVDLKWWVDNILSVKRDILLSPPQFTVESDASLKGWGGCLVTPGKKHSTGGNWSSEEACAHINRLELLAAWLTIQCFCKEAKNSHIKVLSDNTTTVAYLNDLGGKKSECNRLARQIWEWCYTNGNWITASHLPGTLNCVADAESRSVHDNMEWKLNPVLFERICQLWGTPEVDLFASRLNHQVPKYLAWKPDPKAMAIDAFTENWSKWDFYAFPPFNLIGKVLQKVEADNGKGIIIVPFWPTQHWFAKFTQMCIFPPLVCFSRGLQTLTHPWRDQKELPKMRLLVGLISAHPLKDWTLATGLKASSWPHGGPGHVLSTEDTSRNGITFVIRGTRIRCPQL